MKPLAGQKFRAIGDTQVRGIITLRAPASGGFSGTLPRGELIAIEIDPPPAATAVYARPIRYSEMERVLIPASELQHHQYGSYSLVISFESLAQDFELVGANGSSHRAT
jgi:hypothetical protein